MYRYLLYLAIAVFSCHPADIQGEDRATIKLGYIDFPPFYYFNPEGQPDGSFYRLARQLVDSAGYQFESQLLPTRRYVSMIVNGQVDLAIGINTDPSFQGRVLSSDQPIAHLTLTLFARTPGAAPTLPTDLSGKRIALIRGYSYGGLRNQIQTYGDDIYVLYVNDHVQGLQALYGRKLDYLLGYREAVEYLQRDAELPSPVQHPVDRLPMYLLVPHKGEASVQLMSKLMEAFQQLHNHTGENGQWGDSTGASNDVK